uniref:Uncharacterized protein n=1 Tax=Romanomermis culicivorax TaxID=13658 RepID=A0A915HRX9_ROMCU
MECSDFMESALMNVRQHFSIKFYSTENSLEFQGVTDIGVANQMTDDEIEFLNVDMAMSIRNLHDF